MSIKSKSDCGRWNMRKFSVYDCTLLGKLSKTLCKTKIILLSTGRNTSIFQPYLGAVIIKLLQMAISVFLATFSFILFVFPPSSKDISKPNTSATLTISFNPTSFYLSTTSMITSSTDSDSKAAVTAKRVAVQQKVQQNKRRRSDEGRGSEARI